MRKITGGKRKPRHPRLQSPDPLSQYPWLQSAVKALKVSCREEQVPRQGFLQLSAVGSMGALALIFQVQTRASLGHNSCSSLHCVAWAMWQRGRESCGLKSLQTCKCHLGHPLGAWKRGTEVSAWLPRCSLMLQRTPMKSGAQISWPVSPGPILSCEASHGRERHTAIFN